MVCNDFEYGFGSEEERGSLGVLDGDVELAYTKPLLGCDMHGTSNCSGCDSAIALTLRQMKRVGLLYMRGRLA